MLGDLAGAHWRGRHCPLCNGKDIPSSLMFSCGSAWRLQEDGYTIKFEPTHQPLAEPRTQTTVEIC